jgi:hypothetical protein
LEDMFTKIATDLPSKTYNNSFIVLIVINF